MATKIADYTPIGTQAAEVLGTGVFTPAAPTDPRVDCIVVQAQVEDVYYTTDGATDPDESPAVGWLIYAGADPVAIKFDVSKRPRFKRSASGAVLQYAYGRRDG